jgi:hypothetical protein
MASDTPVHVLFESLRRVSKNTNTLGAASAIALDRIESAEREIRSANDAAARGDCVEAVAGRTKAHERVELARQVIQVAGSDQVCPERF